MSEETKQIPAFPTTRPIGATKESLETEDGLTLRDYFAAKAINQLFGPAYVYDLTQLDRSAKHAYEVADAMLKARVSPQPTIEQ